MSVSGLLHGAILAWVAFGTAGSPEPKQSLYDMEIRHQEHRIVWYSLRNRLPDVTPPEHRDPRPPRARLKFSQTLVAGRKELDRPPQMIWIPAPEVNTPKPLPLPNLVAVEQARPVRQFTPPPEKPLTASAAPSLPQAPDIAASRFEAKAVLPAAEMAGPLRQFTAPAAPRIVAATNPLPDAPQITPAALTGGGPLLDAEARGPIRAFARPRDNTPKPAPAATLPNAPELLGAPSTAEASLAIAGLTPSAAPELPEPPGSRAAGFSAAPALHTEGGAGPSNPVTLQVPGLLARGGDTRGKPTLVGRVLPFSRETLAGVPHPPDLPAVTSPKPDSGESPESVLRGRYIYNVAFQMPNVTSYSGSWTVWFAEHEASARQELIRAPVPLRKVDPKYIASAAADGIQGRVRLFGVIRKDGHVDGIVLLKGLDARLDRSSEEALGKWVFEPARRGNQPVDVDAVFEIPFHLAPKPVK